MEKGFSLAELLVYLVIVGVLSGLGIPVYQTHIARARLMEGLSLIQPIKFAVQEVGLTKGFGSISNNSSLGLPAPESLAGNSVSKITVLSGGKIQVNYDNPLGALLFSPTEAFGILRWDCQAMTAEFNDKLPQGCKPLKAE